MISAIALLHQHQRERHTATTAGGEELVYIEATIGDIALANRLAHEVLGRSLDELPPQTRRRPRRDRRHGRRVGRVAGDPVGIGSGSRDAMFGRRAGCRTGSVASISTGSSTSNTCGSTKASGARRSSMSWRGPATSRDDTPRMPGLVDVDQLDGNADVVAADGRSSAPSEPTSAPQTGDFGPPTAPQRPPFDPGSSPNGNGRSAATTNGKQANGARTASGHRRETGRVIPTDDVAASANGTANGNGRRRAKGGGR